MFSFSRTIGLPADLTVVKDGDREGVFEIKGLYPGYGHTMGNALRRVVLSSLPGTAVVSVKIEGVDHEFATMDGVVEDVLRIVLNLQKVRARIVSGAEATASISVTGPATVTAASIKHDANLEIVNTDEHICEITKKGVTFSAEIVFASGVGYVPKTQYHKDRIAVGTILLDAVFTPIKRVYYDVENMRVGDRTDYNKVIFGIETDGTLTPREALDGALRILLLQIQSLLSLSDTDAQKLYSETAVDTLTAQEVHDTLDTADMLKTRIETLNLSSRMQNALVEANIRTVGGLVRKTERDILDLDGIGPKGVDEIKLILSGLGLYLKE